MKFFRILASLTLCLSGSLQTFAEPCNEKKGKRKHAKIYVKAEKALLDYGDLKQAQKLIEEFEKFDLNCFEKEASLLLQVSLALASDEYQTAAELSEELKTKYDNVRPSQGEDYKWSFSMALLYLQAEKPDKAQAHLKDWMENSSTPVKDSIITNGLPKGADTSPRYLANLESFVAGGVIWSKYQMEMAEQFAQHHRALDDTELADALDQIALENLEQFSAENSDRYRQATLLGRLQLEFPDKALRRQIEGECEVTFDLSKEGTTSNVSAQCSRNMFIEPAENAIRAAFFKPTLKNGEPIEVKGMTFPVGFVWN